MKIPASALLIMLCTLGCKKDITPDPSSPTEVQPSLNNVVSISSTSTSFSISASIGSDGGAPITAKGICWGTTANPDINGPHSNDGVGIGAFTSAVSGLTQGTTYYVRAFATNSKGTGYSPQLTINTAQAGPYVTMTDQVNPYTVAKIWKDGIWTPLAGPATYSRAKALFITNSDVYVAGSESIPFMNSNAKVWKNGVGTFLAQSQFGSQANSIYVSGSDVYVAGVLFDPQRHTATLWKNGVATPLNTDFNISDAHGVFVSGSDCYVVGSHSAQGVTYATLWKNGVMTHLALGTAAFCVYVNGTDVYVGGRRNSIATIWKNGVLTSLTNGSNNATVYSIFVNGNDVYAVGDETNNGPINIAKLWKNGVATSLTDGTRDARAESVFVYGNDVYVSGYESNNNFFVAKLWKNGISTPLTNGTSHATSSAVFVK